MTAIVPEPATAKRSSEPSEAGWLFCALSHEILREQIADGHANRSSNSAMLYHKHAMSRHACDNCERVTRSLAYQQTSYCQSPYGIVSNQSIPARIDRERTHVSDTPQPSLK